ncbi:MAG: dioxygenase [Candidatus Kapabacteria bacterium]|jgi:4,5-DOPA dioxygenase extradiol|nr:dioxygenase [Candidatus Kapabacteria bacterium]
MTPQSAIFVSHGTIYEAFKSTSVPAMFRSLRERSLPQTPKAIVVISGHWLTPVIRVTRRERLFQMDEGFPQEFRINYTPEGSTALSDDILARLHKDGIAAEADSERGLDHGALIPLMTMFPDADVPVVQVSLQQGLEPKYHAHIASILAPLLEDNVLILTSGGAVHNRDEIVRFSGMELLPDTFAKEFDEAIATALLSTSEQTYTERLMSLYHHPLFTQSHPTSEHFLPLIIASALGKRSEQVNAGFQWKNLSMAAYRFWS